MALNINTLDSQGYWMVGDSHIYIPSTPCNVEHSNVVSPDSGRDESGLMHIFWARRDVRKVLLVYNAITATELTYMMNLMQGKEFDFTFYDQGTIQTFHGYVGESKYEFFSYSDLYEQPVYTNFKINVIEK